MSTYVALMDRPGWESNTDVIVVVRPRRRDLLWVPRDLWSERIGERINRAFAGGGHDALLDALRGAGVRVGHGVCVPRELCEEVLDGIEVTVPVEEPLRYWYPLAPALPIEDGRKLVRFDPPSERLSGERLHQWLGARLGVGRFAGDIERLSRQQVALREALRQGLSLGAFAGRLSLSGPGAVADLAAVRPDWRFSTLTSFHPGTAANGDKVVFRRRWPGALGRFELRRRVTAAGGSLD